MVHLSLYFTRLFPEPEVGMSPQPRIVWQT